ncbi:MAG: D-alanine--D-alanine ligase family protein [Candidatus Levyibacteriota bacterium]|jgi:D-alanine-D-alanine ligase
MEQKKRIAVIFGGVSPEHEVSVITGLQTLENLDKEKFEAIPIYVSKNGELFTGDSLLKIEIYRNLLEIPQKAQRVQPYLDNQQRGFQVIGGLLKKVIDVDVIFPCFHGGTGENGAFQGLFELINLPYVGSTVLASAMGMDKVATKQLFERAEVPITKYYWFCRKAWEKDKAQILAAIQQKLVFPLFVKPASAGSSVGVTKAKNAQELENAIEVALLFDRKVIAEEAFVGREINISVMGNSGSALETSVCEEVFPSKDLLSYDDKYNSGNSKSKGMASAKRKIPADITSEIETKIKSLAKTAYQTLDCAGLARVDFLFNEKKKQIVLLEVNTIPGSLSYYLWEPKGIKFKNLLTLLIDLALERYGENRKNTTSFPTNILENFDPKRKTSKI